MSLRGAHQVKPEKNGDDIVATDILVETQNFADSP